MSKNNLFTKSDYLTYRNCPASIWFYKNAPQLLSEEQTDPFIERLKKQGYEVEQCARKLHPDGTLVKGKPEQAARQTQQLIAEGTQKLFQASFLVGQRKGRSLFASCDILVYNELLNGWDIIEVKSSTSFAQKNKEHLYDAAFQRIVAQRAGLRIANVYLMELNKEYIKEGDLDLNALFILSEITTECIDLEAEVLMEINHANHLLAMPQPTDCSCKYKGRSRHCRAFKVLYAEVPAYSVYDLRAVGRSQKTLRKLVDGGHLSLDSIPEHIQITDKHKQQVAVALSEERILKEDKIVKQLEGLQYPLYFLDYETLACGVPKYDKTYPYQQTVFQYSLHIVHRDGRTEHKEYIHKDASSPVHVVTEKLREDIGDVGSVIVWNQGFEGKCNQDLAALNPHLEDFILGLNERIYDLMKIFQRMEYLHNDFGGKYSIKKVLPVMCPELDYNRLEVSNGAEAVVAYEALIFGQVPEPLKPMMIDDLLEYCKLDTWAMVRIFQELEKMVLQPAEV